MTAVDPELLYRGYRVEELATSATFLEVGYLLLTGELPTNEQWADWQALLLGGLTLPTSIANWIERVPASASPADVVLGAVSRVRLMNIPSPMAVEQDLVDGLPQWLGFLTAVVARRYRWSQGEVPLEPRDDLGFAANLWWLFTGRDPSPLIERSLDALLIIAADHGLAPATLAVRLAAVAGADFLSALEAGAAVSRADRPVGQAEDALQVLSEVRSSDRAVAWVKQAATKRNSIPGFEHRIYRVGDPRAEWLAPLCRRAAESLGRVEREELASAIESAVWDERQRLPSVIWPAARLLDYLGFDHSVFGPLYVISRMTGWAAHYLEQRATPGWPAMTTTYVGHELRRFSPHQERT